VSEIAGPARAAGARSAGPRVVAAAGWIARNKVLSLAILVWVVALFAAAFPQLLTSRDPNDQELVSRLIPPLGFEGAAREHPLGTDTLGADVYSRLVYGTRTTVIVSFLGVAIGLTLGMLAGLIGGYFRRSVGTAVAALIDVQMAFPGILLALVIAVMLGTSGTLTLAVVIGITGWAAYARILRGMVLSLREREFVTAARASGSGAARIMRLHLVPNVASTTSVLAVIDLSRAILTEASLSFLGLGIHAPTQSWGLMLAEGQAVIYTSWWLVTIPGVAIALLVLSANVIANSLQGRVDPLLRTAGQV
jgi:peptide/nickel transport system permease protein